MNFEINAEEMASTEDLIIDPFDAPLPNPDSFFDSETHTETVQPLFGIALSVIVVLALPIVFYYTRCDKYASQLLV